jgi:hypothetical protein
MEPEPIESITELRITHKWRWHTGSDYSFVTDLYFLVWSTGYNRPSLPASRLADCSNSLWWWLVRQRKKTWAHRYRHWEYHGVEVRSLNHKQYISAAISDRCGKRSQCVLAAEPWWARPWEILFYLHFQDSSQLEQQCVTLSFRPNAIWLRTGQPLRVKIGLRSKSTLCI